MSKKVISVSIDEKYLEMLDACCRISHPSRSSMIELCIQNQFLKQLTEVYLPCREEVTTSQDLFRIAMNHYSHYRCGDISLDDYFYFLDNALSDSLEV